MITARHRRIRWWLAGLVLLLLPAACAGYLLFQRALPGAGAVYETAPDVVAPGQRASITLRLAVWGAPGTTTGPGAAQRRYRQPQLLLSVDGGPWRALPPAHLAAASDGITCRFDFPVPGGARRLAYRFRFEFDGQRKEVAGKKTIDVVATADAVAQDAKRPGATARP